MPSQPKVLFVLSSHDKMGSLDKKTGWYLPEFAHPYEVLAPHTDITIASPKGGAAPLDPSSVESFKEEPISANFLKTKEHLWQNTSKLSEFIGRAKEFDALFYVGGHGPMFDIATDPTSHALISEFYSANKIVSAVCHGPAAFVNVKIPGGGHLLDGQRVTGFSNAEEDAVGLSSAMPFMLEDELNKATGGHFEKAAEPWGKKVVVDRGGRLITGQNPASATGVGQAIYDSIFGELTSKDEI